MDLDNLTEEQAELMLQSIARKFGLSNPIVHIAEEDIIKFSDKRYSDMYMWPGVYIALTNSLKTSNLTEDDYDWWTASSFIDALKTMVKYNKITIPETRLGTIDRPSLEELSIIMDMA